MKHIIKFFRKLRELVPLALILVIFGGAIALFVRSSFAKVITVEAPKQEEPKLPIEDIIKDVCDKEGVSWIICIRVAICESGINEFFSKDMPQGGRDRGSFALNSRHYAQITDECAFSAECSAKVFADAYKAGRAKDWLCYNQIYKTK